MNYRQIIGLIFLLPHASTSWCMSESKTVQAATTKLMHGIKTQNLQQAQEALKEGAVVTSLQKNNLSSRPESIIVYANKLAYDEYQKFQEFPILKLLLTQPEVKINEPIFEARIKVNHYEKTRLLEMWIPDTAEEGSEKARNFEKAYYQLLLSLGADPNLKNYEGKTIYDQLNKNERSDFIPFVQALHEQYLAPIRKKAQEEVEAATPLPHGVAGIIAEYHVGPKTAIETKQAAASATECKTTAQAQTVGEDVD